MPEATGYDSSPIRAASEVRWLAAYTRPKHECRVREYCQDRNIEAFLPTFRSWRRWSDRRKLLDLPLFPSYVFIRVDEEQRRRAVQAPGFLWFVHQQGYPVRVDEAELEAVRQLLNSGLQYDPLPEAQLGDEIEIMRGPLQGQIGRLVRKQQNAIALLVSAINGGVRITLPDASWVRLLRHRYSRPKLMRPLPARSYKNGFEIG